MTNYNLEDLPYPMFELTKEEIEGLKGITQERLDNVGGWLCVALGSGDFRPSPYPELISKIRSALGTDNTLNCYFVIVTGDPYFKQVSADFNVKTRLIWIRKLIEFNEGK